MFMMAMINDRFREVPSDFSLFTQDTEKFGSFFKAVIQLSRIFPNTFAERDLVREKNMIYLEFLVNISFVH